MLSRILCVIIGYIFGLFQTGYIYGRAKGVDIRNHGSGNSGATNTLRVLGRKAGIIVLLGDVLKCILAVVVTYFIFATKTPELKLIFRVYTGLGVVLGHNFPFYLNFKGGKGIAASAGLIITMGPWYVLVHLALFCLAFFTTHYVSLGSILVYICFFVMTVICGQMGVFNTDSIILSQPVLIEIYIVVLILTIMAIVRHKANIIRLLNHEESKVYLSKKGKDKK